MSELLTGWQPLQTIELTGALLGLAYIILSMRQNILTWPVGLATSLLYVTVFFHAKFYAGMGLQVYYACMSIYGWHYWIKGKKGNPSGHLPVTSLTVRQAVMASLVTLPAFGTIFLILQNYTDSPVPFMDAFTTTLSIIATWMLARKILFNWLIWVVADICSIGLYIWKELWPTAVLFLVYTVLAIFGYIRWKSTMSPQPV